MSLPAIDRRPTLLEGVIVLVIGFRGMYFLWKYLPWAQPVGYAWVMHLWMALVPLAWCVLFRRQIPFAFGNIRAAALPAIATLAISVAGLFTLYFMVGRAQLAEVFPGDPASLFFEAIAPGLGEEVLFRGFFQTSLSRALPGFAVPIAAIIFGVAHLTNGFPLPLLLTVGFFSTLIGLGLGLMYQRTGNLLATIVAHNALNLINCGIVLVLPG